MNKRMLNNRILKEKVMWVTERQNGDKKNIRTDLAVEAHSFAMETGKLDTIEGVKHFVEDDDEVTVTTVVVESELGSKSIKKPIGNYYTIDIKENLIYADDQMRDKVVKHLSKIVKKIATDNKKVILIIGLGNWNVTPDALGPKVVNSIDVSRHVMKYLTETEREEIKSVAAFAPGVLGITGIETFEMIKGAVEHVKPDLVILIDALAARDVKRISKTIQVTDTGITPGSGVGNRQMELSKSTLGVPVCAMGVPTVIDANNLSSSETEFEDMVVTPKEIDKIISECSSVIAEAISIALGLNVLYN